MPSVLNRRYAFHAAVFAVIVAVDQWTKHLTHTRIPWGDRWPVIPGFFDLTYLRNPGAAFSLLDDAPAWFRVPFFLIIPVVALVVLAAVFYRTPPQDRMTSTALTLIMSGAFGNFIDRLTRGYVVDFLYFHWKNVYYWPAFNVADSAIVVGVGLIFVKSFMKKD